MKNSATNLRFNKWLILSHGFNMDGRAASLTVTDKIPDLLNAGVEIQVISAITGIKDTRFPHYQLLPWGPSGLRFDLRHWCELKIGRGLAYKAVTSFASTLLLPFTIIEKFLLGLSNQASWTLPATLKGWQLIRSQKINLVYSSGGAWSAHYAGWLLKKLTGVKWMAEIHDPMVQRNTQTKHQKNNRNANFLKKLETKICKDADLVWWFTKGALDYAHSRNPSLGHKGFCVPAGSQEPKIMSSHSYKDKLHLCHFGSMADDRSLEPLLKAIALAFETHPEIRNNIQIDMYGSPLDQTSTNTLNNLQLEDIVQVHGRLLSDASRNLTSRDLALIKMSESDILLLLHGNSDYCEEYIPSKWYDYLHARRPVLALTQKNITFNKELANRNSYIAQTNNIQEIANQITSIFTDWKEKKLRIPHESPIFVSETVKKILKKVSQL